MTVPTKPPATAGADAPAAPEGAPLLTPDSPLVGQVQVTLQARLGAVVMSLQDLLALRAGAVVPLDRAIGEPVDLLLNDALVARGEIVAVDDHFAVRLLEVGGA